MAESIGIYFERFILGQSADFLQLSLLVPGEEQTEYQLLGQSPAPSTSRTFFTYRLAFACYRYPTNSALE